MKILNRATVNVYKGVNQNTPNVVEITNPDGTMFRFTEDKFKDIIKQYEDITIKNTVMSRLEHMVGYEDIIPYEALDNKQYINAIISEVRRTKDDMQVNIDDCILRIDYNKYVAENDEKDLFQ